MTKWNMYPEAETWNPFQGCEFECSYCRPSFQAQAKRQKQRCMSCYRYEPHCHPERLGKIPNAEIVFVAGNGDIAFCPPDFVHMILDSVELHSARHPGTTYYLQTKRPDCLRPLLGRLPAQVMLVTTLETNHDEGYERVSKAPPPSIRYREFLELDYPRKAITAEPVLEFDEDVFLRWLMDIEPEYVWLGFNSRPRQVSLPEPPVDKVERLETRLQAAGITVRRKTWR